MPNIVGFANKMTEKIHEFKINIRLIFFISTALELARKNDVSP